MIKLSYHEKEWIHQPNKNWVWLKNYKREYWKSLNEIVAVNGTDPLYIVCCSAWSLWYRTYEIFWYQCWQRWSCYSKVLPNLLHQARSGVQGRDISQGSGAVSQTWGKNQIETQSNGIPHDRNIEFVLKQIYA